MPPDKAAADANAAAWAAYYAQYGQQPQASMTPTSGAPGTTQPNGQGNKFSLNNGVMLVEEAKSVEYGFEQFICPDWLHYLNDFAFAEPPFFILITPGTG